VRGIVFLALLSFFVALGVRLYGVTTLAPHADEGHWVGRSAKLIWMLKNDPAQATTHLGHPGIPPAAIMAFGQWVRGKVIDSQGITPEDPRYLYKLDACRLVIAGASSLVVPVVFFGVLALLGVWPAFLAAMFLALDPRHIGYSQMAHLDTILTLFVTAAIFLYVYAVQKNKLSLKLLAGACWGFAIATKPTAGILLVCFLVYRFLRCVIIPREKMKGERSLLSWSDVGAFVVGHACFAAMYTRLWTHASEYRGRLEVRTVVAKLFWRTGIYLKRHPELLAAIVIAVTLGALLSWWIYRKKRARWMYHSAIALGSFGVFTVVLSRIPQVFETTARFWKWASGLSGEQHMSFGHLKVPTTHGYFDFFISEMPTITLIAMGLSLIFLVLKFRKEGRGGGAVFLLFAFLVPLLWIFPLNLSSKQTWRYAIPVVPVMYVLVGFGMAELLRVGRSLVPSPERGARLFASGVVVVIALQMYVTLSWRPNYQAYFNSVTGGLRGAIDRNQGLPFVGQNQVVRFLMGEAKRTTPPSEKFITVFGGSTSLDNVAYRLYGKNGKKNLKFAFFSREGSDYVLSYESHRNMIPSTGWEKVFERSPVFTYKIKGVPLAKVYEVPLSEYQHSVRLPVAQAHRTTGKVELSSDKRKKIAVVRPGVDKAGHMLFNEGFRVPAGNYLLRVPVGIYTRWLSSDQSAAEGKAIRIEFGGACERVIEASDLAREELTQFVVECEFKRVARVMPRIFWYGSVPVVLGDLELQRLG